MGYVGDDHAQEVATAHMEDRSIFDAGNKLRLSLSDGTGPMHACSRISQQRSIPVPNEMTDCMVSKMARRALEVEQSI
jgi:hypothetical protein